MRRESIIFWKKQPHFGLLSAFLAIAFAAIIFMLISRHLGSQWVYTWEKMLQVFSKENSLHSFEKGLFEINLQVPIYFMYYQYFANPLQIPLWASVVWVVVIALGASVLSAAMVAFRRIYFLGSATLLILFLVSLKIDLLGIFGIHSKWLVNGFAVVWFLGINYYFHIFGKQIDFWKRLLINLLFWSIFLGLIFGFSQEKAPAMYLTGYGIAIPAIVTLATIFLVSSELPFLFASLTATHSLTGKLNFKSFHLIMLFYVGNLVLLYLKNTRVLILDIFYIDDFYILAASLIFGLWGVRHNPLFQLLVPEKLRTWVYVALVLVATATIGYFHSVANEAATAALEDYIVYSHLGFGVIFWIYVLFNFRGDQSRYAKTPFATLFYDYQDEKTIPLYIARGMGFMLMGLLIYKENSFTIKQSFSAYYGGMADAHLVHYNPNNYYLANDFYDDALSYDATNHRFWYAKASLISLKGNATPKEIADKISMYEIASQRDPQPHDYAHIAQEFLKDNENFLATMEYKEALDKFPKNPYLSNNLAMLLAQENVLDSAMYYFQKNSASLNPDERQTNFLSLLTQKPVFPADSLEHFLKPSQDCPSEINRLAVLNLYRKHNKEKFRIDFVRKNLNDTSTLNKIQLAYLYNFLATAPLTDTMALHLSQKLLRVESNLPFSDKLNLCRKIFYFNNNQNQKGIETARFLNFISASDYQFNYAKYLLYLGESQKAAKEFRNLASNAFSSYPYEEVIFHAAIAYSESHDENSAQELWQRIASQSDKNKATIAQKMLKIYKQEPQKWQETDDTTRFGLVYYRKTDTSTQIEITKSLKNPDLKVKAIAFLMQKMLEENDTETAQKVFALLPQDIETSLDAQSELNVAYLKLLFLQNNKAKVAEIIEQIPLTKSSEGYRYFLKAWLIEDEKTNDALKAYADAIESNPFDLFFYPKMIALQNKLGKQQTEAYDFALQATRFKEEDVKAWILHFEQCLEAQYYDYAQSSLSKIKELSPELYPKYQTIFEQRKR